MSQIQKLSYSQFISESCNSEQRPLLSQIMNKTGGG